MKRKNTLTATLGVLAALAIAVIVVFAETTMIIDIASRVTDVMVSSTADKSAISLIMQLYTICLVVLIFIGVAAITCAVLGAMLLIRNASKAVEVTTEVTSIPVKKSTVISERANSTVVTSDKVKEEVTESNDETGYLDEDDEEDTSNKLVCI
jgi:hypothetical protein